MTQSTSPARFFHLVIHDEVLILRLHVSRFCGDELAELVRDELFAITDDLDVKKVVLDLQDVREISSRGLGGLAAFYQAFVKVRGGQVVLCNLQPRVKEVLSICRFISSKGASPLANLQGVSSPTSTPVKGPRALFHHVTENVPAAMASFS